jgi:hypothetical protein
MRKPAIGLVVVGAIGAVVAVAYLALYYWRTNGPAPTAQLRQPVVVAGKPYEVSASGFLPYEPVDVAVGQNPDGSGATIHVSTSADGTGLVEPTFVTLPAEFPSGAHPIAVAGQIGGKRAVVTGYLRSAAPWVTPGDGDVKPFSNLGLVVGGFSPHETVTIRLQPDGSAGTGPTGPTVTLGTLPTDLVGNSRYTTLRASVRAPGKYVLLAKGQMSGLLVKKPITLTPYQPLLDLSPWYGPPGVHLQFNARGFAPGERIQVLFAGSAQSSGSFVADSFGNAWGAGGVQIPVHARPGQLDVQLVGDLSGATVTRQFAVQQVKPWLTLSSYWGAPSAPVDFSGGGWTAGEEIDFHLGSALGPVVGTSKADAYGWLHETTPLYIPRDANGVVIFVATGQDSHAVATAKYQIVLPFGLRPT